jgi:hypothetical protein
MSVTHPTLALRDALKAEILARMPGLLVVYDKETQRGRAEGKFARILVARGGREASGADNATATFTGRLRDTQQAYTVEGHVQSADPDRDALMLLDEIVNAVEAADKDQAGQIRSVPGLKIVSIQAVAWEPLGASDKRVSGWGGYECRVHVNYLKVRGTP